MSQDDAYRKLLLEAREHNDMEEELVKARAGGFGTVMPNTWRLFMQSVRLISDLNYRLSVLERRYKRMQGELTPLSLVDTVDDLKHRLKPGASHNRMLKEFNDMLNDFLHRWKLDTDKDMFATWPNRIAMKCTACGEVKEMNRVEDGSRLPMYRCSCGTDHEFEGAYEDFSVDDEGWGGPFGH
jgi:hypothetical protein